MSEADDMPLSKGNKPVRDQRPQLWFWSDREMYQVYEMKDGAFVTYAAVLGPSATSVYGLLCSMADRDQTAFPSVKTIAWILGMSDGTAGDSLMLLRWHGLVKVQEREATDGDSDSNLYTLLPVRDWRMDGGCGDPLPERIKERLDRNWEKLRPRTPRYFVKIAHKKGKIPKWLGGGGLTLIPGWANNQGGGGLTITPPCEETLEEQTSKNQQQQGTQVLVAEAAAPVAAGAAVVVGSSASLVEQAIRGLKALKSAIDSTALTHLVQQNPAHAAYVLREWPHLEEADPAYWEGRKGNMGGCLRKRLENLEWRSDRDRDAQAGQQRDAQLAEARAEQQRQREAAAAFEATLGDAQLATLGAMVEAEVRRLFSSDFVGQSDPRRGQVRLRLLNDETTRGLLAEAESGAGSDDVREADTAAPRDVKSLLKGLASRRSMPEVGLGESEPVDVSTRPASGLQGARSGALDELLSPPSPEELVQQRRRCVDSHLVHLRGDVYGVEELDEHRERGGYEWSDEDWANIVTEIRRQFEKAA